jgi:ferredoxin-type protein NapH
MKKYRFLILRRFIQIAVLALFVVGNYTWYIVQGSTVPLITDTAKRSWWMDILKGDYSASLILDKIPLTDPFAFLQMIFAGSAIALNAALGAAIIFIVYALIGGRTFCSYVCPMNLVTDFAAWSRDRLGLQGTKQSLLFSRSVRYWMIVMTLLLSFVFGVMAFETISPIGILQRGFIFGFGLGILVILAIFLFDLFALKHGFCGHICPLGGFYAFISRFSLLRVKYSGTKCTHCMKCKAVCPEKQVLDIVDGQPDACINSGECTRCGRCIEVCEDDALKFSITSFCKKDEIQ